MINKKIADLIKKFNQVLFKPGKGTPGLQTVLTAVGAITGADALLVNRDGTLIEKYIADAGSNSRLQMAVLNGSFQADSEVMALVKKKDAVYNTDLTAQEDGGRLKMTVVPLPGIAKPTVSIVLVNAEKPFDEAGLILAEMAASLAGLVMMQRAGEKDEESQRNRELADGAFESLSYSEVEAIQEILKSINNNESVVVASKIADRLGITRSVIVNALRKFESAGIIESRSLGMKGTFIKVKNSDALDLIASRSLKF